VAATTPERQDRLAELEEEIELQQADIAARQNLLNSIQMGGEGIYRDPVGAYLAGVKGAVTEGIPNLLNAAMYIPRRSGELLGSALQSIPAAAQGVQDLVTGEGRLRKLEEERQKLLSLRESEDQSELPSEEIREINGIQYRRAVGPNGQLGWQRIK